MIWTGRDGSEDHVLLRDYQGALDMLMKLKEQFEKLGYTSSPFYQDLLKKISLCEEKLNTK